MEHTLNTRERNQAFIKFLVFFTVTVIIVVGSIYFNFKIPLQLNEVLKADIDNKESELKQQGNFVESMNKTKLLIDSLQKEGTDYLQVSLQIESQMKALSALSQSPNDVYETMNEVIINSFLKRITLIKKEKDLGESLNKLKDVQTKLTQCELENSILARRQPTDN